MRTNLLASAAALCGVLYSGLAVAQVSTVNTLLPDNRSLGALGGSQPPSDDLDPGSIRVRLGGHVNFYGMAVTDSGNKSPGYKQANYGFSGYAHLNPSVDGVAANGLRYGTFVDIWNEKPVAPGGGAGGAITNVDRTQGTLYVRRAWVYAGLPQLGTIRIGSGDSPAGLFETGTFENFNDGAWNGDAPGLFTGNSSPTWPFALVGNLYTPTKATYLSPQLYGFEFGVSYEPNTSAFTTFDGGYAAVGNPAALNCNTASSGCGRLSSSSNPADLARRLNMVNPEFRYRGTFGPVGLAVEAGYMGSGVVGAGSGIAATATRYQGFNMGIGGIAVTYGGLTVGGHVQGGYFNGQWGLAPAGTNSNAFAYLVGASYTVGPVIVGASFFQYNSAGNSYQTALGLAGTKVGQMRERGIAAGGTYTVVPGFSIFLDYLYGDRRENGWDLLNGGVSTLNNATKAQGIGLGTQLRW